MIRYRGSHAPRRHPIRAVLRVLAVIGILVLAMAFYIGVLIVFIWATVQFLGK